MVLATLGEKTVVTLAVCASVRSIRDCRAMGSTAISGIGLPARRQRAAPELERSLTTQHYRKPVSPRTLHAPAVAPGIRSGLSSPDGRPQGIHQRVGSRAG